MPRLRRAVHEVRGATTVAISLQTLGGEANTGTKRSRAANGPGTVADQAARSPGPPGGEGP